MSPPETPSDGERSEEALSVIGVVVEPGRKPVLADHIEWSRE